MNGIEALRSGAIKNAGQIDHRVSAFADGGKRVRIADIGLHRHDLPGDPERLHMAREIGPAAGDADAIAAFGERPHDMPAEKARAADDGDQCLGRGKASRASNPSSWQDFAFYRGVPPLQSPNRRCTERLVDTDAQGVI